MSEYVGSCPDSIRWYIILQLATFHSEIEISDNFGRLRPKLTDSLASLPI